jgi:hypothetical protein
MTQNQGISFRRNVQKYTWGPVRYEEILNLRVKQHAGSNAARAEATYVVGVPALRSWETAVTSWAGANGLVKRMLLGTPCEPYSSALAPVM